MQRSDLAFKMKELEFDLIDKVKSSSFTLNKKDFLKKTESYLQVLEEVISFFRREKIETLDKILVISMDNHRIFYELINYNDNNSLSKISMMGDFYIIYGKFNFKDQNIEKDLNYRLFFSTTRGSITLKLDPFSIEQDSFVYKIAS